VTVSAAAASPLVYAFRGNAILLPYALAFTLCTVAHLERSCAENFGFALLLASGLAIAAAPVRALQIVVTQVDKNADGSITYQLAVKIDQGETLTPGESERNQ
jgi:hypothetical protein